MKKLGVYCAATVGAMAVAFSSLAFLSTGVAAADDYAGQTYGDALGAIKNAGKKVVISSRSGNAPAGDNCLVTHSEVAPWRKGTFFSEVTNTVLLDLNCNAKVRRRPKRATPRPARRAGRYWRSRRRRRPRKRRRRRRPKRRPQRTRRADVRAARAPCR